MQLLARWHLYIDVSCMHVFKRFDRNLTSSDPNLQRSAATDVGCCRTPSAFPAWRRRRRRCRNSRSCWAMRRLLTQHCSWWRSLGATAGCQLRKWNEFRSHWEKWWFMFMIWRNLLILVVFLNIELPFSFHMIISNWTLGKWSILVQQWVERVIRCQCGYMFWLDLMGKPSLWRWVRTIRQTRVKKWIKTNYMPSVI